jgi:hypothetical protein
VDVLYFKFRPGKVVLQCVVEHVWQHIGLEEFQLYVEIVVFNFYTKFPLAKFLLKKSAPYIKLDCFRARLPTPEPLPLNKTLTSTRNPVLGPGATPRHHRPPATACSLVLVPLGCWHNNRSKDTGLHRQARGSCIQFIHKHFILLILTDFKILFRLVHVIEFQGVYLLRSLSC